MSDKGADSGSGRVPPAEPGRDRLATLVDELGLEPSPPSPCPYLPGRDARVVVVRPQPLTPPLYHAFMDLNFRRLGDFVYRPQCEACRECRQLRVRALDFTPNRAQRRCARQNRDVTIACGPPEPTAEKHAVYRRYLAARHDGQMSGSWQEFEEFVDAGCSFAREAVFRIGARLLGAGIFDETPRALSAVYFYFDPELARRSPGVLNVLWLLERCRRRGSPWLYLGYHVTGCHAMSYKRAFAPAETLGDDGRWR